MWEFYLVKHVWKALLKHVLFILLISNAVIVPAKSGDNNDKEEKHHQQQQTNTKQRVLRSKPNIIIILIDDMGFNDVSFHGSNQILTPNIDALAYNGIILNHHYVPNLCTPSRAALLTGKYPIHTGTQHYVIVNDEPWGLPLSEQLMPEVFRDAGYATHLVGKWHLGFWRKQLTPTMRGFDHHYGYYSGYIDYYDHTLRMLDKNYSAGLDFRRDLEPWPEASGSYATEVFTQEAERIITEHDERAPLFLIISHLAVHAGNEDNPLQAPEEEIDKFMHISDPRRRTYAGMISSLDASVARTMRALADKGILNNTIVLLYSDNGAPTMGMHANAGSNHPFRGQKESPWEGGVRSAGLIWSPLLRKKNYVSDQVIHAVDWLPTLASVAGIHLPNKYQLDGVDIWDTLNNRRPPQSRRLLHVLDDVFGYSSYMRDNLKYINGSSNGGRYDGWLGKMETEEDPLASYYIQHVLSSTVHELIDDHRLSRTQVEQLRLAATNRCPVNPYNLTDEDLKVYRCEPLKSPCYFDLAQDPCERYNLAKLNPLQVELLEQEVRQFRLNAVPSARVPYSDVRCDPARHEGVWHWWYDTNDENTKASGGEALAVGEAESSRGEKRKMGMGTLTVGLLLIILHKNSL